MSDMRCDQCAHWDQGDVSGRIVGVRACLKAKQLWDCTEWVEPTNENDWAHDRVLVDASVLMYVQDGSDYSATLYTKPEFFCAHLENKSGSETSTNSP